MSVSTVGHNLKLTVERAPLLKAIQQVGSAINERGTLPILSHLLLQTTGNALVCTATDLDMGITVHVPLPAHDAGGLAVPARRFIEMIKELPEGPIQLHARKNQSLVIETPQCAFRLVGLPAEEFPQLPPFPESSLVHCEQQTLKSMLTLTSFAMSSEEARYILNGSLFHVYGGALTVVATDGRRLALANTTLPQHHTEQLSAIVPSKTIRELLKFLEQGTVDITLLAGNQILFRMGQTTVISRLIEGEFPSYDKVIPPAQDEKVYVDRGELLAATRRASLLVTPTSQSVRFDVAPGKLTIFKETPDIGEVREELSVQYAGKPLTIHFNPQYLLDILKVVPEEHVAWELSSPERPGVVRSDAYLYIVLPMQPT